MKSSAITRQTFSPPTQGYPLESILYSLKEFILVSKNIPLSYTIYFLYCLDFKQSTLLIVDTKT